MPRSSQKTLEHLRSLSDVQGGVEFASQRMAPRQGKLPPRVPGGSIATSDAVEKRLSLVNLNGEARSALEHPSGEVFAANIENLIGTVKIPVGLAGPLRVNGIHANGDYYIPMATTEAALVASYNRGCLLISEAGGSAVALLSEGVARSPGFVFSSLREAGLFVNWATAHVDDFKAAAASTTAHGYLNDVGFSLDGNHVYFHLEFFTKDAAGQNMATIAAEAVCEFILESSPIKPVRHYVEANFSGDKKASALAFQSVRGRKVSAEVIIVDSLLRKYLGVGVLEMERYWRMSAMGAVMSGTIGVQGHFANGLAALYLACGQDVACVSESAVGVTRMEKTETASPELRATVTLPALIVGTVGGGTHLPSQAACLDILGLRGPGKARAFAEVAAALCLAGELSIIGALAAGHFTRAHRKRARGRDKSAR